MKTLITLVAATALLLTGCTTQYQARATYDDLYYSPKDAVAQKAPETTAKSAEYTEPDQYTPTEQYQQQQQAQAENNYAYDENYYQEEGYDYQTSEQ